MMRCCGSPLLLPAVGVIAAQPQQAKTSDANVRGIDLAPAAGVSVTRLDGYSKKMTLRQLRDVVNKVWVCGEARLQRFGLLTLPLPFHS